MCIENNIKSAFIYLIPPLLAKRKQKDHKTSENKKGWPRNSQEKWTKLFKSTKIMVMIITGEYFDSLNALLTFICCCNGLNK